MNKKSFVLYGTFYEAIKDFSLEEKGQLLDAIFLYQLDGLEPESKSTIKIAFNFIKIQFKLDDEKYQKIIERNQNNGLKGGRPKLKEEPKKPSGLSGNPEEPKKPDDVDVDVDDVSIKGKLFNNNYAQFIDFFNQLTKRKFRTSDKKAERQFKYLVKEGYAEIDFKKVILNAYGDKYHKETNFLYLTPEFLTRTDKWDRYLAQENSTFEKIQQGEKTEEQKAQEFDEAFKKIIS